METTIYDVDYFIRKFSSIPEEKWCINTRADRNGNRCALGWCYPTAFEARKSETESNYGVTGSDEDIALCSLFNLLPYPWVGGTNNGLEDCPYKQPTPKQRILAALYDIKKLQQPKVKEPKERVIYKTVIIDSKVKELQEELNSN